MSSKHWKGDWMGKNLVREFQIRAALLKMETSQSRIWRVLTNSPNSKTISQVLKVQPKITSKALSRVKQRVRKCRQLIKTKVLKNKLVLRPPQAYLSRIERMARLRRRKKKVLNLLRNETAKQLWKLFRSQRVRLLSLWMFLHKLK